MTRLPRRCLDCGTLTWGYVRCDTCSRRRAANWGYPHQIARAALRERLRANDTLRHTTLCGLCHQPITTTDTTHADHTTPVSQGGNNGWQLTHARCNLQAGDKKGTRRGK
jgi:5-methylcytosine-specific restriction endonuclease McrA